LTSPATAPTSFTYTMTIAPGLTPALTADGAIIVTDAAGDETFNLPAPFIDDAAGAHSTAIHYTLTLASAGRWLLGLA
jgi:hypothetical protein